MEKSRTKANGDSNLVRASRRLPHSDPLDYDRAFENVEVDALERERQAEFKYQQDFWE